MNVTVAIERTKEEAAIEGNFSGGGGGASPCTCKHVGGI